MPTLTKRTLTGMYPALVTPFTDDHQLNVPVLKALVDYLIGKGVDGFYVCGTTGEGVFMSVEERELLAETVIHTAAGRAEVIVHVGSMVVRDAMRLAAHAERLGAGGVASILPPMFSDLTSLRAYYEAIASAAPNTGLLCYLLNPNLDAVALMQTIQHIPSLVGLKYTGPNMYELRRIIDLGRGEWYVFSGMDEECLYAAMMGVTGAVGSTLNFMPGVYREMHRLVKQGAVAEAQTLQVRANRVTEAMIAAGFPGALKAVMGSLGFACGDPRLPNLPLSTAGCAKLMDALAQTDFKDLSAL
jgi:N-acetylneuraminate lyase